MPSQCNLLTSKDKPLDYLVIAFYHLYHLENPEKEVALQKKFLASLDVKARTYVSKQGINAQMSALRADGEAYMEWLLSRPEFKGIEFKIQPHFEHVLPRLTVKTKKELAALGVEVSIDERGTYLSPAEWRHVLESSDDKIILDVRNDYEWELGHFEGSEPLQCTTFKESTDSIARIKQRINEKTKVLMYCTGGIRCELFSSLLKKEGIENVYQLHGGIIRYGEEEKSKHWSGKLFVFDDRLAVDLSDEKAPVIAKCCHCSASTETYYNCANMDCNELFLSCSDCLENLLGCCQESCKSAERVRPFQHSHKPFRRWYNYANKKKDLCTLSPGQDLSKGHH
ncbi:MAG: hypothetical protein JWO53_280 [Chlamydiia bacterium]|nr:hypothetical protein [Chlamydiia bacterium]